MPQLYGKTLSYHEAKACQSPFFALGYSMACSLGYKIVSNKTTRNWLKKHLPPVSQFPPPKPKNYKPGEFEMILLCEGSYDLSTAAPSSGESKEEAKTSVEKTSVKVVVQYPDEMGWTETSKMLGESILTAVTQTEQVRSASNLNGGVVTPATLGDLLLERLEKQKVVFAVEDLS